MLLIRRIRELLYDQGFTIIGARNRLSDAAAVARAGTVDEMEQAPAPDTDAPEAAPVTTQPAALEPLRLRAELLSIRELLSA